MDWSTLVSELLRLALAVAVPFLVVAVGRLAVAALKAAETYMDAHDLGVAENVARAAITYAEVQLAGISGKERMEWVLSYLRGRGIEIDEAEAESLYQDFAAWFKERKSAAEEAPANA